MVVVGGSCRGWEGPARLAAAAARRQRLVANDGGLPRAVPAAAAVSAVAAGVNINNKNATGAHRMGPAATRSAAGHRTPPSRRASRASHPRPADDRDNGATPYPQGKGRASGQKAAQRPARQTHARRSTQKGRENYKGRPPVDRRPHPHPNTPTPTPPPTPTRPTQDQPTNVTVPVSVQPPAPEHPNSRGGGPPTTTTTTYVHPHTPRHHRQSPPPPNAHKRKEAHPKIGGGTRVPA